MVFERVVSMAVPKDEKKAVQMVEMTDEKKADGCCVG